MPVSLSGEGEVLVESIPGLVVWSKLAAQIVKSALELINIHSYILHPTIQEIIIREREGGEREGGTEGGREGERRREMGYSVVFTYSEMSCSTIQFNFGASMKHSLVVECKHITCLQSVVYLHFVHAHKWTLHLAT